MNTDDSVPASAFDSHPVVSRQVWLESRLSLLAKEKELTRMSDALAEERRRLPWVLVDKPYRFETSAGAATLSELFAGRSQLAIYHFMFAPDWEEGCPSCSLVADHLNPAFLHLAQRDVTLILASRAPLSQLEAFKQRMEWTIPWVSTYGSDFNFDYGVTFPPTDIVEGRRSYNFETAVPFSHETGGMSVFARRSDGSVCHCYSTYGRGGETMMVPYFVLDRVPRGRDESGLPWTTAWLRHHDRYDHTS